VQGAAVIPVQLARACVPDDWRPCLGDFFECACCGERSEEPFPYAEPMDSPGLDLTQASAWFYYCRPCAFDWIFYGADVRRVVSRETPGSTAEARPEKAC
jgi:hypothetical protein